MGILDGSDMQVPGIAGGMYDMDALKQLLGAIQPLSQALGPSQADKDAARNRAIAQMGFALMGARRGQELQGLGQAGLLGLQGYNQDLQQIGQQRAQSLGLLGQMMPMLQKSATMQAIQNIFANNNSAPQGPSLPAPSVPQGAAGGSGMGGGTSALFGPSSATAPLASAQAPRTFQLPTWRQLMPRDEQMMLAASGDPKAIVEGIRKYTETKIGPNGTVTTQTGIPLYRQTDAGVQFFNPDGTPGEFAANPQEATKAEAARAGAIQGAQTAAQKAAEFPYQTSTFYKGNTPYTNYTSNVLGAPNIPGQAPSIGALPSGGRINLTGPLDARQVQLAVNGATGAQPQGGGFQAGADPREAAAIATQAEQNNVIAKAGGQDYANILEYEKQAPGNIAKFGLMKDYFSKVDTGAMAPSMLKLQAYARYIAPDLAKNFTAQVPYAQAAAAMGNELALQLRNPAGGAGMPGSMSDQDRNFLISMTASAANDPKAIPMMIDARIAIEKRSQEVGKLAREYYTQNKTIDAGFYQKLQDYSNSHPMFAGLERQLSGAPTAATAPRVIRFDANGNRLQ